MIQVEQVAPGVRRGRSRAVWISPPDWSVTAVAAVLFAAVAALRWRVDGPGDAVALLFCAPITLLAWRYGVRGGLTACALGVALLAAWTVHSGVTISALGWVARVTPLLLCGLVVGRLADRHRAAATASQEDDALARAAVESNDRLVQHLAAAKWCLESGQTERALVIMDEAVELGHALVSDLVRESGMGSAWKGPARPGGRSGGR